MRTVSAAKFSCIAIRAASRQMPASSAPEYPSVCSAPVIRTAVEYVVSDAVRGSVALYTPIPDRQGRPVGRPRQAACAVSRGAGCHGVPCERVGQCTGCDRSGPAGAGRDPVPRRRRRRRGPISATTAHDTGVRKATHNQVGTVGRSDGHDILERLDAVPNGKNKRETCGQGGRWDGV